MQSSSSHASGMAKCRHGGGESRIYLNGRMCDFTGIHSTHRSKILLSSPTKIHWTLSLSFPHQKLLHVLLPQYRSPSLQGYADRRFLSPQTQSHFKKIQRTAFGSKEAFEMWKNLECRTQVDGEVISPWPNKYSRRIFKVASSPNKTWSLAEAVAAVVHHTARGHLPGSTATVLWQLSLGPWTI